MAAALTPRSGEQCPGLLCLLRMGGKGTSGSGGVAGGGGASPHSKLAALPVTDDAPPHSALRSLSAIEQVEEQSSALSAAVLHSTGVQGFEPNKYGGLFTLAQDV